MKNIIFDFNGTVLDDVDVCIEAENRVIKKFLPERSELTREEYLELFTFPVKDYYARVGFDFNKNSYHEIGAYWFEQYCSLKDKYKIFDGVEDILKKAHKLGYKNILLSASKLSELKIQLDELGIADYFDEVYGTGDIYASSKEDVAHEMMKDKDPKDYVMIGDSLHDLDVAKSIGVRCILVARGHQSKHILEENHDEVVDDIREIDI